MAMAGWEPLDPRGLVDGTLTPTIVVQTPGGAYRATASGRHVVGQGGPSLAPADAWPAGWTWVLG